MKPFPALLLAIPVCVARSIPNPEQFTLHAFSQPKANDPLLGQVIDASPLLSFHRSLVTIPSVSNTEESVGDYVASFLEAKNFTVVKQLVDSPKGGHRFNVYAYIGDNVLPDVLVTSHIDTVPPFLPYKLSYNYHDSSRGFNRSKVHISGRGTVDDKARYD